MSGETFVERQLSLVQALYSRTKDGKVDWQAWINADGFTATFGEFNLRIRVIRDDDYPDHPDYVLTVERGPSDQTIETISNATLRPVMERTTVDGLSPYRLLQETYEMARRKALNVEDALDRILATLNER
jgi:hypothetical protein